MVLRGLIFDFDGVVADSEALANGVLPQFVTRLGFPTTLDDALTRYMGKRWSDTIAAAERDITRRAHSRKSWVRTGIMHRKSAIASRFQFWPRLPSGESLERPHAVRKGNRYDR